MSNLSLSYFLKSVGRLMLMGLTLSLTGLPVGCTKDEPTEPKGNHRPLPGNGEEPNEPGEEPNEPGEEPNDNPGGSQPEEATSKIVGEWLETKNSEKLVFGEDGQYMAYLPDGEGWRPKPGYSGTYTYSDLARWLWISTDVDNIMKEEEYRCVIDETTMTLTTLEGVSTIYLRQ